MAWQSKPCLACWQQAKGGAGMKAHRGCSDDKRASLGQAGKHAVQEGEEVLSRELC